MLIGTVVLYTSLNIPSSVCDIEDDHSCEMEMSVPFTRFISIGAPCIYTHIARDVEIKTERGRHTERKLNKSSMEAAEESEIMFKNPLPSLKSVVVQYCVLPISHDT